MVYKLSVINTVYAISFLDLFAIGLTFPLFSIYLREIGASHYVIGLMGSTYSGTQILSGPVIGSWSDVRGRKSVLKITLFICGIAYGLLGLTSSIYLIFFLRFLLGLVKQTQSICKAVINDLVPPEDQTGAFGRSAAFGSIGFIAGPFLGGHLSEFNNGFFLVCAVTTVLFIGNFWLASTLPEILNRKQQAQKEFSLWKQLGVSVREFRTIDWRLHWDSFLLRFLFALSMTTYLGHQGMFLKETYMLSQRHIGYCISFFSTLGTTSAFFLDYINRFYPDDHSCFQRLSRFFTILTATLLGIFLSGNLQSILFLFVPLAFSCTLLRIVSMELMIKEAKKSKSGMFSGTSNSIMSVARFIVPFLSGVVAENFGKHSVILLATFIAVMGMGFSFYFNSTKETKQINEKTKQSDK